MGKFFLRANYYSFLLNTYIKQISCTVLTYLILRIVETYYWISLEVYNENH